MQGTTDTVGEGGQVGARPGADVLRRAALHEYLERTTCHVGQHVRRWIMLLGLAGIAPDRPPVDADFADLPMPSQVGEG